MLVSEIKEVDLTIDFIDKLLFQGFEDTGENADCIIVLGSMKAAQYRIPGLGDHKYLLFSGTHK